VAPVFGGKGIPLGITEKSMENVPAASMKNPLVELRGLTKAFPEGDTERVVFRNLCAEIGRGESVALLGRSGSGKSTLLNLIGGIDLPSAGDVIVDGTNLHALSERRRTMYRRRHIGFVFQSFNLIPTLTVMENVLLPLELNGRTGSRARTAAEALLRKVGLADRAATYPDRLSGGEQQRIAVARALVHDPVLILADEPTGSLDAETGKQVLELLAGMARGGGRTMIVVTHSDAVARTADRTLAIREGRLVEETLPGEVPA
jgi:putative ABC transport system ATP-binding protein